MTKDEKFALSNDIKYDIEMGVYNNFPKLKKQMLLIADKLFESIYVVNSSKELSENELKTLSENGYIYGTN